MRYRRCRCGKIESWSSGLDPQACEGCLDCNTTLEVYPDAHKERIPHDFVERTVTEDGKTTDESYCRLCGISRESAERMERKVAEQRAQA